MTIVDKKKQGEKIKKKGAKAPPLFLFFFFLSRWCEKCNVLVRESYLRTHFKILKGYKNIYKYPKKCPYLTRLKKIN